MYIISPRVLKVFLCSLVGGARLSYTQHDGHGSPATVAMYGSVCESTSMMFANFQAYVEKAEWCPSLAHLEGVQTLHSHLKESQKSTHVGSTDLVKPLAKRASVDASTEMVVLTNKIRYVAETQTFLVPIGMRGILQTSGVIYFDTDGIAYRLLMVAGSRLSVCATTGPTHTIVIRGCRSMSYVILGGPDNRGPVDRCSFICRLPPWAADLQRLLLAALRLFVICHVLNGDRPGNNFIPVDFWEHWIAQPLTVHEPLGIVVGLLSVLEDESKSGVAYGVFSLLVLVVSICSSLYFLVSISLRIQWAQVQVSKDLVLAFVAVTLITGLQVYLNLEYSGAEVDLGNDLHEAGKFVFGPEALHNKGLLVFETKLQIANNFLLNISTGLLAVVLLIFSRARRQTIVGSFVLCMCTGLGKGVYAVGLRLAGDLYIMASGILTPLHFAYSVGVLLVLVVAVIVLSYVVWVERQVAAGQRNGEEIGQGGQRNGEEIDLENMDPGVAV